MPKTTKTQIKQENEIQSYINSFKEMEEEEEADSAPKVTVKKPKASNKAVYITPIVEESEEFDEENPAEEAGEEEEYKYVFIVQDDEDTEGKVPGETGDEEIYEFEDFGDEEMVEEIDDKSKIPKIANTLKKKELIGVTGSSSNHICNFCNYSTSKRYLLARHMKVRMRF